MALITAELDVRPTTRTSAGAPRARPCSTWTVHAALGSRSQFWWILNAGLVRRITTSDRSSGCVRRRTEQPSLMPEVIAQRQQILCVQTVSAAAAQDHQKTSRKYQ